MNAPSDRDLILRTKRGETEAFGELVTRYQTSVFNVCYRILHERGEAEDLAQEAFIRAYDRIHTFDIEREFGPWIRRVAANLCLNHLESQKVTTELTMNEMLIKLKDQKQLSRLKKEANRFAARSHPCPRIIGSSSNCGIIRKCPTMKSPRS